MIGLTDTQLATVMTAARTLPVERRDTFLQRVGAMLRGAPSVHRYRCFRIWTRLALHRLGAATGGLKSPGLPTTPSASERTSSHGWGSAGHAIRIIHETYTSLVRDSRNP